MSILYTYLNLYIKPQRKRGHEFVKVKVLINKSKINNLMMHPKTLESKNNPYQRK